MIRRGLWLTAGAVTGIYGYRRACALGRRLSGRLTAGGTAGLARETFRFARDVREGMELYMARPSAPVGPTLSADRTLSTDQARSTGHDPRPKDGR